MMKKILMVSLVITMNLYFLASLAQANEEPPQITSEAAVLMDMQSGAILFGKNEEIRMYPASLTKIATAIYAIEKGDLDDEVIVSEEIVNIDGTRVYLNPGEKVTLKKLIQGMLINSGNDAALAIALHLDGTMERYSQKVNGFLKAEIGVKKTHFTNPHGLFNENHYTTAKDLGIILNYAMKNKDFREIFGTKQLDWQGESWETTIFSHHRLLKGEIPFDGVTGGKTGFVDQSKQTLATTADNGQLKLTAILLKSEFKRQIYKDTIKLFDFGFAHFKSSHLSKDEEFSSGKQRFKSDIDSFLTEPVEQVERVIDPEGFLIIKDGRGDIIQKLQLKPIIDKQVQVNKTTQKPEQNGLLPLNSVIGGVFFLLAVGVWILNRRQKRNRRFRSR